MKTTLQLCFILILPCLLTILAQATTISGVKTLAPPTVLGTQQQTTEPEGKTTLGKDVKPTPALPGKTVSPVLPITKPPATKTPGSKMPVSRKPGMMAPGVQKSPLGQRPQPQLKPLLTKPGMRGATSVSGVTVGKMQGTREAALVVMGKGLTSITSALLFLNNIPVGDVTLKRGQASDTSLKISLASSKGDLVNKGTAGPGNYELRLRAGMQEFKMFTPIGSAAGPSKFNTAKVAKVQGPLTMQPTDGSGGSSPPEETPPEGSEGSTPPADPQMDGPDLIVSNIRLDPPNPVEGEPTRFAIDIQNQGNWAATFPGGLKLIEVSTNQNTWTYSNVPGGGLNLLPGQTHTVIKYHAASVGTNPVWVRVDPQNTVTESNENNNETAGSVTVLAAQGPPDLVITDIQTSPASPSVVTGFSLVITVENQGGSPAIIYSTQEAFRSVGTNNILQNGVLNLSPGQSAQRTIGTLNISPGPFNWTIKVDPQNTVAESDENNNTMSISGTIGQ